MIKAILKLILCTNGLHLWKFFPKGGAKESYIWCNLCDRTEWWDEEGGYYVPPPSEEWEK